VLRKQRRRFFIQDLEARKQLPPSSLSDLEEVRELMSSDKQTSFKLLKRKQQQSISSSTRYSPFLLLQGALEDIHQALESKYLNPSSFSSSGMASVGYSVGKESLR